MTKIPEWQEYCDLVEPDVNLLKVVLENANRDDFYDHVALEAVKQKYLSLIHEPTVIEKTMTPKQLFTAGHPLWAKPYTIDEIEYILRNMHECTCYEDVESMICAYKEMVQYLKEPYLKEQPQNWKGMKWT